MDVALEKKQHGLQYVGTSMLIVIMTPEPQPPTVNMHGSATPTLSHMLHVQLTLQLINGSSSEV